MSVRRTATVALLVLGTLLWTIFGFGLWAKRQALDNDNWVDTSAELLEDEQVRNALALFIVDQLFDSAEVQSQIESVLPDRLDPLAGPAAAGLKEAARRTAPRVLGSAAALQAWREANSAAHRTLIDIVEGRLGEGQVSLDLKQMFAEVADGTGLPPDLADRLPPEVASLVIADADELQTAQGLLNLFETLVWVLVVLSLAAFGGAIALSEDRRRAVMQVGGGMMFATILLLAVRRLAGDAVIEALAEAPNAQAAADDVWEIATSLLVDVAQGSFLIGLFIVTGAWLAGEGRRATSLRRLSAYAMRERPGVVRAGLGAAILLLVIWGPVAWTQRFWAIVIFTAGAFAWLEWVRRRTLEEFPDEPAPQLRIPVRRPAGAHESQ